MKRSIERIETTHTGSLPRSLSLVELLFAKDQGKFFEASAFDAAVREAVDQTVQAQLDAEISVINDGEQGKTNFYVYRHQRLSGFELQPIQTNRSRLAVEAEQFPDFYKRWLSGGRIRQHQPPPSHELCCT